MSVIRKHIDHGTYLNWFVLVMVAVIGAISVLFLVPGTTGRFAGELLGNASVGLVLIAGASVLVLGGLILQRRDLLQLWTRYEEAQQALRDHAEKHASRVYALLNVSRMMVTQNDLDTVFGCVTKTCVEVFGCDLASLMLFDADNSTLEVRAASGKLPDGMLGTRQALGTGIAGYAAQHRRALLLRPDQVVDAPGLELKRRDVSSAMVVPIILRDELVGVVNVSTKRPDLLFDKGDLRALQVFAENVGTAIRHTEQAEWMRATIRKLQEQKDRNGMTGTFPARPA
jgi:transcriptional regulator with GAF, ATPase, and Fis domain